VSQENRKMARNIKIYKMKDIIHRTEAGTMDLKRTMAVVHESATLAIHYPESNILIDVRETEKAMSFGEVLDVATALAKYKDLLAHRLAILGPDDPDRVERGRTFKTAAELKGVEIGVFTDYEAAVEWLADVTTHHLPD
jgi:hypothetical protein